MLGQVGTTVGSVTGQTVVPTVTTAVVMTMLSAGQCLTVSGHLVTVKV